jgi:hypothetical protein
MINLNIDLQWNGNAYISRLRTELSKAIRKSAGAVRNEAIKLLNTSGKSATRGLNKVTGKGSKNLTATQKNDRIFQTGISTINNLKKITSAKTGKTLIVGGSIGSISRIYWYGPPLHRWVQSSPPGSPPHSQTGNLKQILIEFSAGGLTARVGPKYGLKYARIQELGGRGIIRLPPRPYMRPAFESQQVAIMQNIADAIAKAK